jgi:hypothetical protein
MKEHVESLCRQHEELRALADEYERELGKANADLAALASCRWKLARLVSSHLAYERTYVLGSLATHGGMASQRFADDLKKVGDRLSGHVREWTPAAIADDWAGYGRACRALINLLRAQMASEEADLYPLLLKAKAA